MNTIRRRNILLALSTVCLAGSLRAAVVGRVSLLPALGMAQSVPAFRASVLSQIALVDSLSAQPVPTLSMLSAAEPTPADPWHAEAARLVGALVAQPQAVALHQDELRAALGGQGVERLTKAATRLTARAAERPELLAQLDRFRAGLNLDDAGAVQELGARLNALFENSGSKPEDASGGVVAAAAPAQARKKMPSAWRLQPAAEPGRWHVPRSFDEALAAADALSRPKSVYSRSALNWAVLRRSILAQRPQVELVFADSRIMDAEKIRALQEELFRVARSRATPAELATRMALRLEDVERQGTVPMVLFRKPLDTIFGDIPLSAPQRDVLDDLKQAVLQLGRTAPNRRRFLHDLESLMTRLRAVNQWDSDYPEKLRRIFAATKGRAEAPSKRETGTANAAL